MDHADEIMAMGVDPWNLGVHLIRKGAAMFCCNGMTSGVSITAVYLWAGWTLGNVQDPYTQFATAGDQVCGRTLAGLDVFSHDFVISPPHLIFSNTGLDNKDDTSSETTEEETFGLSEIKEVIQCVFGDIPTEWGFLARYLIASLLYHRDWLSRKLHRKGPLRLLPIFHLPLMDTASKLVKVCWLLIGRRRQTSSRSTSTR
jgi:hypothetical protein